MLGLVLSKLITAMINRIFGRVSGYFLLIVVVLPDFIHLDRLNQYSILRKSNLALLRISFNKYVYTTYQNLLYKPFGELNGKVVPARNEFGGRTIYYSRGTIIIIWNTEIIASTCKHGHI